MANIYTCPTCSRRYTIYLDGDYICECGNVFAYPPVLSSERSRFISMDVYRERQDTTRRRRVAKLPAQSAETRSVWRRALGWATLLL